MKELKATEEGKQRMREYYQKNRDRLRGKAREYYHAHKNNPEFLKQKHEYAKKYYSTHKEEIQKYLRSYKAEIRLDVFTHYSNGKPRCVSCGFDDMKALTLDHIHGGGAKHRKECGNSLNVFREIIKEGYPEGYQVLCMNCQFIKMFEKKEWN